jgi:hypothetical protein
VSRSLIRGLVLDAGALLAIERADPRVRELLRRAVVNDWSLAVPAGALARAWRGGPRQDRLLHLLAQPEVNVAVLDEATAKAVGQLCGITGQSDVIDVHVALHATETRCHVVTSDPDDMRAISPSLPVISV